MGGLVLQIPVQPMVMMFGFSSVPQDTIAGGTGERSVPPFQNIFDIIFPFVMQLSQLHRNLYFEKYYL